MEAEAAARARIAVRGGGRVHVPAASHAAARAVQARGGLPIDQWWLAAALLGAGRHSEVHAHLLGIS